MKWMIKVAIGMLLFAALIISLSVAIMRANENIAPTKLKQVPVEIKSTNEKIIEQKPT